MRIHGNLFFIHENRTAEPRVLIDMMRAAAPALAAPLEAIRP
jgi:hypothetical protein